MAAPSPLPKTWRQVEYYNQPQAKPILTPASTAELLSSSNHSRTGLKRSATEYILMSSLASASQQDVATSTINDPAGIIFLDIDGVLLPFPQDSSAKKPKRLFPDETLRAFSRLLHFAVGAKIVLSSTWRVRQDYQNDILDCFQDFADEHGDGPLGYHANLGFWSITDPTKHDERQWEIFEWLRQNNYNMQHGHDQQHQALPNRQDQQGTQREITWLVLDDEELIEGEENEKYRSAFEGHVIKTASNVGLTEKDVDKAIELWKAQIY